MTDNTKINMSHLELRRFAQRAIEIIDRHAETDPMLTALGSTLGPAANMYMTAYESAHAFGSQRQLAAEREKGSIAKVHDRTLGWVQVIARDVPRFNPAEYSVRPEVSHDVIGNARKALAFVTGYPTTEKPLPYAQQIIDDLSHLIAQGQQDANASKASLVRQQELKREVRNTALEFYRQLLLYRRVLRRVLGATHRDCQLLKFPRAGSTNLSPDSTVELDSDVTDDAQTAEAEASTAESIAVDAPAYLLNGGRHPTQGGNG